MIPLFDPRSDQACSTPIRSTEPCVDDPVQRLAVRDGPDLWSARGTLMCSGCCGTRCSRPPAVSARGSAARGLPTTMLNTDEPDHSRSRSAVAPVMRARAAAVRAGIRLVDQHVGYLEAALADGADVDLVSEFAFPLAVDVLGRFLGVPAGDLPIFAHWGAMVAAQLDPFADPDPGSPAEQAMTAMLDRFADYLMAPAADSAVEVLARAYAERALSAGEVLSTVGLLVVGGLEPLADALVSAIAQLLAHDSGSGLPPTGDIRTRFEELLRYDPPIQFTARTARADVRIGDCSIAVGDTVIALLGSANHDSARFANPDVLALDRRTNPHLAFGAGSHACLGAPLARAVGHAVLRRVEPLLPSMQPNLQQARRRPVAVPHGYLRFPVRRQLRPT